MKTYNVRSLADHILENLMKKKGKTALHLMRCIRKKKNLPKLKTPTICFNTAVSQMIITYRDGVMVSREISGN